MKTTNNNKLIYKFYLNKIFIKLFIINYIVLRTKIYIILHFVIKKIIIKNGLWKFKKIPEKDILTDKCKRSIKLKESD